MLDGLVLASDGRLVRLEGKDAIVRSQIPNDKVALLIGGGSGHEPMFPGFVGENLADGAACGQVFAAPAPDLVLAATKAVNRGTWRSLRLRQLRRRQHELRHRRRIGRRRGHQMCARCACGTTSRGRRPSASPTGAASPGTSTSSRSPAAPAATLDSLDEVYRVAAKARDNTRSMGVAIAAGSIPETGALTFELGPDEIEIGMGAHGEPGISRQKLTTADAIAEQMMAAILPDSAVPRAATKSRC